MTEIAAHQPDLTAYVQTLLPGDPSVGDVVQRSNLVAWKKRSSFTIGTNFRAWLFGIARWEVMAYRKECARRTWLVVDEELANRITDSMVELAEESPMDDLRLALEVCLQKLQAAERELVTHRYYSSAPLKRFATEQGKTVGALKISLHRIRATLKRCIESQPFFEKGELT